MSRRRIVQIALIAALIGVAIGYPTWSRSDQQPLVSTSSAAPDSSVVPVLPAPRVAVQRGTYTVGTSVFSDAQARAFASAGLIADGLHTVVPHNDADVMRWWEWAEQAVADQPLQPGLGALVRIGGQGMRIRQVPARAGGNTASEGDGAEVVADEQRQVVDIRLPGTVTATPEGQRIEGEGVFAGLRIEPGDPPLRISDPGGQHAIRLHGDDFGPVRVNGGLVIPGRTYRIIGDIVIESAGPVGIDIVPLIAAPDYHDEPFFQPVAPG